MAGIKGRLAGWDIDAGVVHSESKLDQDYTVLRTQGVIDAFNNPGSATFGYRMGDNAGLNTEAQRLRCSPAPPVQQDDARRHRRPWYPRVDELEGGAMALALGPSSAS